MNKFHRILFIQLIVWIVFYLFSYVVTRIQIYHHAAKLNDQWVFNLHVPVETFLLSLAAYVYFPDKKIKKGIVALFLLFFLFYCCWITVNGIVKLDGYIILAESVCLTIIYLLLLYNYFAGKDLNAGDSAGIWACAGIVIYFACCVPYFSMFDYLNIYYPKWSSFLFHIITDVLANVRYFSLALTFWLIRKKNNISYTPA